MSFERCETRAMMAGDVFSSAVTPDDFHGQTLTSVESSIAPAMLSAGRSHPDALWAEGEGSGSGSGSACDYYGEVFVTIDPIAPINEGEGDDGGGSGSGSGSGAPVVPISGTASSNVSAVEIYVEGVYVGSAPVVNGVWRTQHPYSCETTDDNPTGTPSDV